MHVIRLTQNKCLIDGEALVFVALQWDFQPLAMFGIRKVLHQYSG
jgi:hypothetical protein